MKMLHLFHMMPMSMWPFFTAVGGFLLTSGLGFYMHSVFLGFFFFLSGVLMLFACAFFWFNDMVSEATMKGNHTKVVKLGLKNGFYLFLTSEVMLFFGFFRAFFHSAMCPAMEMGSNWPPFGMNVMKTWHYPFYNTLLLMISGFAVTWAHQAIALGKMKSCMDGMFLTMFLGLIFMLLQSIEYYEADYSMMDGVYGSVFYMLTGLHGCHVMMGVVFLIVCFMSLLKNHFTSKHYLGLIFAMWYWHFVDMIRMMVFLTVYFWGNW